jgi:hypothetical protein
MTQTSMEGRTRRFVRRIALASAALGMLTGAAAAQATGGKAAVDAIVGSEVQEEEARTAVDADKVIAAIDKTADAIQFVRKVSKLDKVEIVFLTDATVDEGGLPPEIQAKADEKKAEITELRKELEGNAMLFHAIDSRQILSQDVIAIAFDGETSATIYTTAKPPAG